MEGYADGKHFVVLCRGKMGAASLGWLQDGGGFVNARFTPGGDAVLPFPQLDHPGFSLVVEINGFTVKRHLEKRRGLVKQPRVAVMPLPGVDSRDEYVLLFVVGKPCRCRQV